MTGPETGQPEIRYLGDVQRLALKPGDVVVLKTPRLINREQARCLQERAELELPGHKILVLFDGIEIGILGSEEAA